MKRSKEMKRILTRKENLDREKERKRNLQQKKIRTGNIAIEGTVRGEEVKFVHVFL